MCHGSKADTKRKDSKTKINSNFYSFSWCFFVCVCEFDHLVASLVGWLCKTSSIVSISENWLILVQFVCHAFEIFGRLPFAVHLFGLFVEWFYKKKVARLYRFVRQPIDFMKKKIGFLLVERKLNSDVRNICLYTEYHDRRSDIKGWVDERRWHWTKWSDYLATAIVSNIKEITVRFTGWHRHLFWS